MKERIVTILLSVGATFGVIEGTKEPLRELEVDRLIVRRELIVSDSGKPWEKGFEEQQIPRGIYARSVTDEAAGGLWVRSRLIKGEIDDPFDDRFHALERNGQLRTAPGHISWNVWLDGNWRQVAIVQGEGIEFSDLPRDEWNGGSHPGRVRVQTFRPNHGEPLTDAIIGQGKMSIGGGGFGGGGLPSPMHVVDLWGGGAVSHPLAVPSAPEVLKDDASKEHEYAVIAVSAEGFRSKTSPATKANGIAQIRWDSVPGADAYIVVRDGGEITGSTRIEGSQKVWQDPSKP